MNGSESDQGMRRATFLRGFCALCALNFIAVFVVLKAIIHERKVGNCKSVNYPMAFQSEMQSQLFTWTFEGVLIATQCILVALFYKFGTRFSSLFTFTGLLVILAILLRFTGLVVNFLDDDDLDEIGKRPETAIKLGQELCQSHSNFAMRVTQPLACSPRLDPHINWSTAMTLNYLATIVASASLAFLFSLPIAFIYQANSTTKDTRQISLFIGRL